jgi:hypothetical protein
MGSISIARWLNLLLGVAVAVTATVWLSHRSKRQYPGELRGIGGWLALLATAVAIWPLRSLLTLVRHLKDTDIQLWQEYPLALYGDAALLAVQLVLAVLTAGLMFRKSRKFLPVFFCTALFMLLFFPIDIVWKSLVLSIQTGGAFTELLRGAIPADIVAIALPFVFVMGAWILYLARSKRVANTFVN